MAESTSPAKARRSIGWRIGKIILIIVGSLVGLVVVLALLLLTPPVQNFARKKAQNYLSQKLQTRFEIGRIYIGFPKKIVLENVYVEDRQKDTLLSGGLLKVDISMLKLLKSEVEINQIELADITAKIKRSLPDTTFNFQFILDAFAPKNPSAAQPADTSAMKMAINTVKLDRVRMIYNDVITGNYVTVFLRKFNTDINRFDPAHMDYDIAEVNLEGVRGTVKQVKPLVDPGPISEDKAEAVQPINLKLKLGDVGLKDIQLDYGNDVSSFYTTLNLGELILKPEAFDLAHHSIRIEELALNNTTSVIRLGKTPAAKEVVKQTRQEVESQAQNDWKFIVTRIRFNNNNLKFDNDNEARVPSGIDYAHLDAKQLTLHVDDFHFAIDSIAGKISKGSLTEKSGLVLNRLETDFLYASREAYLKNLILETPHTTLQREAVIRYPSIESLASNIGAMQLDVNLANSKLLVRDILLFAPMLKGSPGFSNPNEMWYLNGKVTGRISDMRIDQLDIRGLANTRVRASGTISGIPDMKKLRGNIRLQELRTTRSDLALLMPPGSIPKNITLPNALNLSGTLAGSMADARANLQLQTDLGAANLTGSIRNASNPKSASYNAKLSTRAINLGRILQNDTLYGPLTADIAISGRGLDPKTMAADMKGIIHSVTYNRYEYREVALNGSYNRQKVKAFVGINDPNIALSLNAGSDLSREFPSVTLQADIDSIRTLPLHLTTQSVFYHGKIDADFPVTDPKNLQGRLLVTQSLLANGEQRFTLDTIQLVAGKNDTAKFIRLNSDIANLALTGQYDLAQLGDAFINSIQPYYKIIPDYKPAKLDPYQFSIVGNITNAPVLQVFLPDLKRLDPVGINGTFSSQNGWNSQLRAPMIVYGTNSIHNLSMDAGTRNGTLIMHTLVDEVSSGGAMNIYKTDLNATIANNAIDFLATIADAKEKNKYRFGANFKQDGANNYVLTIDPKQLLLNYDNWTVPSDNLVRLENGDINIHNLVLARNEQRLSLNSTSSERNSPLNVQFTQFRIATLTAFLKQDTLIADGRINGTATLMNFTTQPVFTTDLVINDLSLQKDTVGNLTLKVNNQETNRFVAEANLTGKGNDLLLTGSYLVKPDNQSSFDLDLTIRQLQMSTVERASMGSISAAKGFLDGKFRITGTAAKPEVDGHLDFNKTSFNLSALNSFYQVDQESIQVNKEGIRFDSFTIRDSSNNELSVDGMAYTDNYTNYRFDLDVTADDFKAVNSTKRNNQLFYGALNFDTDLHIGGTEVSPKVDGSLTINDKTNFTIVLPQAEPGVAEREGIVRFVDMDSVRIDTTMYASLDSIKNTGIRGMDVAVNIEINKEAVFNIVVDEGNGDFLRMKGEALLSAGIDPSGNMTLSGSYEIQEGAYELSFNMLKRKFDIQKGSKITWLGEPTKADVNVTAVYVANTAPLTLVEDQLQDNVTSNVNRYKQKLPFQVNLLVKGELMKPDISFDVILPEDKNYNVANDIIENVKTRLIQLRAQPSELNKQVFALLLLNRFVSENPFDAGGGGGMNVGTMARQSVSKILTEQLNNLASNLINGVDLNFDVASTEDYTTGQMQNRTDLNVSLSKQLLSDRLKVTVGSNFELEGPQNSAQRSNNIAGNLAIDYMLSKDGRYLIRGYRKNEYEGEIYGYIIETGISFIITLDYNHFHDLFRKKKKKEPAPKKPAATEVVPASPAESKSE